MKKGEHMGVVESPILAHRKKRPILISAESVCDLPKRLVEKHQIAVIPYRVLTEGGEFLDGEETETDGILSYIKAGEKNVHSQPPDVKDYEEFFAEQLLKAQYVIHISFAKNASRGYGNALEASKIFDNVIVIDSGHLSSGMGLMVLQAAQCVENGMTVDGVVKEMEAIKRRVRTSFVVTDTEYLAWAGKISDKIDKLCQALMIHPVIVLKNSGMKVGALRIGTRDYAWKKYIASALAAGGKIDKSIFFIKKHLRQSPQTVVRALLVCCLCSKNKAKNF